MRLTSQEIGIPCCGVLDRNENSQKTLFKKVDEPLLFTIVSDEPVALFTFEAGKNNHVETSTPSRVLSYQ